MIVLVSRYSSASGVKKEASRLCRPTQLWRGFLLKLLYKSADLPAGVGRAAKLSTFGKATADSLRFLTSLPAGVSEGAKAGAHVEDAELTCPGQAGTVQSLTCTCGDFRCCWSPRRGLNSRPLPYQGSALPLSYVGI